MIPDIVGYELDEGIRIIAESGFDSSRINVNEYLSPKKDKIGCTPRILRVDKHHEMITLTISYF